MPLLLRMLILQAEIGNYTERLVNPDTFVDSPVNHKCVDTPCKLYCLQCTLEWIIDYFGAILLILF